MRGRHFAIIGAFLGALTAWAGYGLDRVNTATFIALGAFLVIGLAGRIVLRRRHEARMKVLWRRYLELAEEQAKLEAEAGKA